MGVPDSQDTKRPQLRDQSVEESRWETVSSPGDRTSYRTKLPLSLGGEGALMMLGGVEVFSQWLGIIQAWVLHGHQWGTGEGRGRICRHNPPSPGTCSTSPAQSGAPGHSAPRPHWVSRQAAGHGPVTSAQPGQRVRPQVSRSWDGPQGPSSRRLRSRPLPRGPRVLPVVPKPHPLPSQALGAQGEEETALTADWQISGRAPKRPGGIVPAVHTTQPHGDRPAPCWCPLRALL